MIRVSFEVPGVTRGDLHDIQADLSEVFAGDIKDLRVSVLLDEVALAQGRTESTAPRPGCIPGYTGKAFWDPTPGKWRPIAVRGPLGVMPPFSAIDVLDAAEGEVRTRRVHTDRIVMCRNGHVEGVIC